MFLFLLRQVLRQPVVVFVYKMFYFLRYIQKLQRPAGCYRKAVTILAAQSSSSRQLSMFFKPLYSFRLHYTSGLRKLNTFRFIPATFVSAAFSPFAAHNWLACWSPPAAGLSWFLYLPV